MTRKKTKAGWADSLPETEPAPVTVEDKAGAITLQPALRQIGTSKCPVCQAKVAVYLTRSKRPFINCGFCSARIFYNGLEAMRRLKRVMKPVGKSRDE